MNTFHIITLVLLMWGVQVVLCIDENGSSLNDLTSKSGWALIALTAAVIVIGWVLYRLTEEPTVEIENKYYTVEVGQPVEMRCSALDAFPFIKSVTWEHISPGGRPIQLNVDLPEYTRSKPGHLIINKTVKSDEGEYVCTVCSWYGKRRSTTTKLILVEVSSSSCVYKPATTAKYPSTKETTNYARICRLVVDVIPDIFRQLLIARLPASGLAFVLTSQRYQILPLLNNQQKKIIYPQGGTFQGSMKDFDISLLYILLRNLGNIPPHQNGWGRVPGIADRSLSANIDRLRIQRNEAYGHAKSASLSDGDFQNRWTDIRQSIEDLQNGSHITGKFLTAVDNIGTMRMDPNTESNFIALVKEIEGEICDIKDQMTKDMDNLRGTVDTVSDNVIAVRKDFDTLSDDVGSVRKDIVAVNDDIGAVRKDVDAVSDDVSAVRKDIDAVSDDIGAVRKDIAAASDDVGAVIKDVDTVKDQVIAMKQLSSKTGRDPKLTAMIGTTRLTTIDQTSKPEVISTQALENAKKIVRKNSLVLIKGASGDGKTLMCYQLLKWLMDGDNKDVGQAKDPLQLYSMAKWDKIVQPNTQLAVYIDDVSGEIAKELEKREVSIQSTFCRELDTLSNCLILNVRDEIFRSTQLSSCELFNPENIIDLRGKNCIKNTEKQLILENYVPEIKSLPVEKESEIIKLAPDIGFPQCCRLYRDVPSLQREGLDFFKQPFHFMEKTLKKLPKEHFSALLFLFLNGGGVKKRDLDPYNFESIDNKRLDLAFQGIKLDHADKIRSVRESLGEMFGSLVAKTKYDPFYYDDDDDDDDDDGDDDDDDDNDVLKSDVDDDSFYKFCHDSVQDTVALLFGKDTKIGFIENCPRKFLRYISTSKSKPNKIVITSSSECMYKRLISEFESDIQSNWDHRIADYIVALDLWTDTKFLQGFITWLKCQNVDLNLCQLIQCALLNGTCSVGSEDRVSYLLSVGVAPDKETLFSVVKGGSVQLLNKLLTYDVIPTARTHRSRSSYDNEGINVLHEACLFEREKMVTVLCNSYPDLVHDSDCWRRSTLHLVAQTGNCGIFQTVERTVLKSLCRVEDKQHQCELVDGRVVHRNCVCGQFMSQLVDKNDRTVLHWSCRYGHMELCLELCKSYPTLTTVVENSGMTILHWSCIRGHRELSLELCRMYPALTTVVEQFGMTVLHMSCEGGHKELSLELSQLYPALTTIVDDAGATILHTCCEMGHSELCLELCKMNPALTTAVDNDGMTILHASCRWGRRELSLELCRLYPALTTVVDNGGHHCLHHIARWTLDVDMFTQCELHVKQYVETTGDKYDITTLFTNGGKSVLDLAKEQYCKGNNPLYDHLVKLFTQ